MGWPTQPAQAQAPGAGAGVGGLGLDSKFKAGLWRGRPRQATGRRLRLGFAAITLSGVEHYWSRMYLRGSIGDTSDLDSIITNDSRQSSGTFDGAAVPAQRRNWVSIKSQYGLDIVLTFFLWLVQWLIRGLPQHHRVFIERDPALSYPVVAQTVTPGMNLAPQSAC